MSADPAPLAFVDTNIFVCASANDDTVRAPVAQHLLDQLMAAQTLVTSTQVLQELFVTLTRKGDRQLRTEDVLRILDRTSKFPVFTVAEFPRVLESSHLMKIAIGADHAGRVALAWNPEEVEHQYD